MQIKTLLLFSPANIRLSSHGAPLIQLKLLFKIYCRDPLQLMEEAVNRGHILMKMRTFEFMPSLDCSPDMCSFEYCGYISFHFDYPPGMFRVWGENKNLANSTL